MDIFFEIHQDLPREAPGDEASTARALRMLPALPPAPRILDAGCGPGAQSLPLARLTGGTVISFDLHLPFLFELRRRSQQAGLAARAYPVRMSLFDLGFAPQSFDLIWSEGAIYIRGFDQSLAAFRGLLRPGGCVAVTEASWLRPDAPDEIRSFWQAAYPAMRTVADNRAAARALGYHEIGHFTLPREAWTVGYLEPMGRRIAQLREKYHDNPQVLQVLDAEAVEVTLFPKYLDWFGYEFYLLQAQI
jgi:SAM-dependent methyltransferase